MEFIVGNAGTIVVAVVLAAFVAVIVYRLVRGKGAGAGCGCSGCTGCSQADACSGTVSEAEEPK